MKKEWIAPVNWGFEVYMAIEQFLVEARIPKKVLAQALNIDSGDLGLSHLEIPKKSRYLYQCLPYVFRSDNLFVLGRRLRLDFEGFQALKRLAGRLLEINTGYVIGPVKLLEGTQEAAELGMIGAEHFNRASWETGAPYMQEAWVYFSDKNLFSETRLTYELLSIGAALMAWHSTNGVPNEALKIASSLRNLARNFNNDDPKLTEVLGYYYRAVGVAQRLAERHPDYVIQSFRKAQMILREHSPEIKTSDFRDQAKPYTFWGLKEPENQADYFEQAIRGLKEAEHLDGPSPSDERTLMNWMLTRFSHIECLTAMGQEDEVFRLWEVTMEQDEVKKMIGKGQGPSLYAKWVFAEIAVNYAHKDLAAVGTLAEAFAADPRNARHGERVQRAKKIMALAEQGNHEELRLMLVR